MMVTFISLGLSILSFFISIFTLWESYLSKFTPITTVGSLRFRVYPIKNGKDKWFIPSFDIPINIANGSATPGKVNSIRIKVRYPKISIANNYEMFYVKWEIDPKEFSKYAEQRFSWIENAVKNEWTSLVILPKTTVSSHLIFESLRWNAPIIQEKIELEMQIYTEPLNKWQTIGEWRLSINPRVWSELIENGTSFGAFNLDRNKIEKEYLNPKNLHKHLFYKGEIPKGGFQSKPSYLNYPKQK